MKVLCLRSILMALTRRYRVVATGGTFDLVHKGHRALLKRSFEVGDHVIIGITSDGLARRMGKNRARKYFDRERELHTYLTREFQGRSYEIAELQDFFGPAVTRSDVEAVVASEETLERVEEASRQRHERGNPDLCAVLVKYVLAEDGRPISTRRITSGEIDKEGRLRRA